MVERREPLMPFIFPFAVQQTRSDAKIACARGVRAQ
jgi:hypothetical protein